jgi:DNA modification methylase
MIIEKKQIADLIPAPYNPRQSTAKQEKHLKESLEKFGLVEPIIFNKQTGYIVGGHFRVRELKKLGIKEIECVIVDLNEADEKELNIRLNANTGSWDWDTLANDWEVVDLEAWGLEIPQFDNEAEELEASEDDYDVPEGGIETDIVIGDLFEIGEHRLLCGDSTDSDAVARLMNGEKAEMVFTDPPYNYKKMGSGGAFSKSHEKLKEDIKDIANFNPTDFLNTLPLVFNKGINAYIFCNADLVPDYCNWAKENKFNFNILTWHKKSFIPASNNHHYPDTEYLIYISKSAIFNSGLDVNYGKYFILNNEKSSDHPTIKPIEIINTQIQISSNIKNLVFDFFLGSGSTMVAAHQLKRRCFGMELEPKYCQVIIDRMAKLDPSLKITRNGKEYIKQGK